VRRYQHRRSAGSAVLAVVAATWLASLLAAGAASAHVSVSSPAAVQGGYASLTFKVPTESATASTTGLKVQLPADQPLASVSVLPVYGWTHTMTKAKLAAPVGSGQNKITEAVSVVEWTADSAASAIKPGEFNQFVLSVGPLPKAPAMTFKALQTYSDGTVVSWIEQAAEGSSAEPEHPAPTLKLAAASGSSAPAGSTAPAPTAPTGLAVSATSGGSDARANTALGLGAVGILLGGIALAVALLSRRPAPGRRAGS
jgi:periplasmic copper chaperone A